MRTISIRLDEQTDALLQMYCGLTGMSQTEVISAGIARMTTETPSSVALAEQLGLIGCFDGASGDLGRNHAQRVREKLVKKQRAKRSPDV
jgi:hypothetical protein